jgi:hypothetical protein
METIVYPLQTPYTGNEMFNIMLESDVSDNKLGVQYIDANNFRT